MKKFITLLLLLATIFTLSVPTFALEPTPDTISNTPEKIFLDDGTYITITLTTEDNYGIALASNTYTRTGTKTVENHSDKGELLWQYNLTGTFTVNEGISATCTNAAYTHIINNNDWKFSDGNAYAENNVAHGVGTFKKKVLFVTLKTYNIDISITCDAYGNLS